MPSEIPAYEKPKAPPLSARLSAESRKVGQLKRTGAIAPKSQTGAIAPKSGKALMTKKIIVTKTGTKDKPVWTVKTLRGCPYFRVRCIDYGNRVMLRFYENGKRLEQYLCYLSNEEWSNAGKQTLNQFIKMILEKLNARKQSDLNNRDQIEELFIKVESIINVVAPPGAGKGGQP